MLSILPSIFVLGLAAVAALLLAQSRGSPSPRTAERLSAARALALATVLQGVHFAEEATTGFPQQLGALLDIPGMSGSFFVAFNVLWLGIWVASVPGVRSGRTAAFFAAWFLAIAGTLNGILHPLLAVAAGGYFPGLVSAPVVGLASVWLGLRLRGATAPRGTPAGI